MIIKEIKFPKTNNNFFHKLEGRKFYFLDDKNNPAKFVFFIGENGSGKTTLLYWLYQINELCWAVGKDGKYKIWNSLCSSKWHQHDVDKNCISNDFSLGCVIGDLNFNLKIINGNGSWTNLQFQDGFRDTFIMQCLGVELHPLIKNENYHPIVFCRLFTVADYLTNDKKNKIKNEIFALDNESKRDVHNYKTLIYKGYIHESPHILETTFKKINDVLKKYCGYQFTFDWIDGALTLFFSKVEFERENKYLFSTMSSGEDHLLSLFYDICVAIIQIKVDKIFLFIDEVENSLSPKKQEKILEDLDNLLKLNNEKIEYQSFIATHSPFILKNFLNRKDTAIINVETGENIKKSESKKLLLNKNVSISYDEISYLYYDIVTSGYYISLYETMNQKFKCFIKKIESFDLSSDKDQIVIKCLKNGGFIYLSHCLKDAINALNSNNKNKWKLKYSIDEFLLEIGFGTRETLEIYIVAQVCNWMQMQNENRTCMNEHEELSISTNLTRLRHVLAHDSNLGEINHRIYEDKSNVSKFKKFYQNINKENKKDKTKYFYDKYKKNPNELLKSQIETIRVILIDWERIIDKVFAYFLQRK